MMHKYIIAVAALALSCIVAAPASDPLTSLQYLVGTWNCSFALGGRQITYKATFAYDLGNNWLREDDAWVGGGTDLAMFTYDPKTASWVITIAEQERNAVVFRGAGADPDHVVYHSVYPDASLTNVFDRVSPTSYTVRFSQTAGGKTTTSVNTCVKT
jgi:hypothetical protein